MAAQMAQRSGLIYTAKVFCFPFIAAGSAEVFAASTEHPYDSAPKTLQLVFLLHDTRKFTDFFSMKSPPQTLESHGGY